MHKRLADFGVRYLRTLGPYSYVRFHDNIDSSLSALLTRQHNPFDFSLWYPYAGGGVDRLALGYFSGAHTFFFSVLPPFLAQLILVLGHIISATLFTYLICRRDLALPRTPAVVAGLIAGASGSLANLHYGGVAYMPFVLWALSLLCSSQRALVAVSLAAVLGALYATMSQPQEVYPFAYIVVFLWFLTMVPRKDLRAWVILIFFCGASVLPRATDLLAMMYLGASSHRVPVEGGMVSSLGAAFSNLTGTTALIVGLVGLALFCAGLIFTRLRETALHSGVAHGPLSG